MVELIVCTLRCICDASMATFILQSLTEATAVMDGITPRKYGGPTTGGKSLNEIGLVKYPFVACMRTTSGPKVTPSVKAIVA